MGLGVESACAVTTAPVAAGSAAWMPGAGGDVPAGHEFGRRRGPLRPVPRALRLLRHTQSRFKNDNGPLHRGMLKFAGITTSVRVAFCEIHFTHVSGCMTAQVVRPFLGSIGRLRARLNAVASVSSFLSGCCPGAHSHTFLLTTF